MALLSPMSRKAEQYDEDKVIEAMRRSKESIIRWIYSSEQPYHITSCEEAIDVLFVRKYFKAVGPLRISKECDELKRAVRHKKKSLGMPIDDRCFS